MDEWNELLIGDRKFKSFEIVGDKIFVHHEVSYVNPKTCLHLQTYSTENSTANDKTCVKCGAHVSNIISFHMNGKTYSGVTAT